MNVQERYVMWNVHDVKDKNAQLCTIMQSIMQIVHFSQRRTFCFSPKTHFLAKTSQVPRV